MMSDTYQEKAEQLYQLLPAYYKIEDAKLGNPLKGLLEVFARQAHIIDKDISSLYENWFIETCDEWVVPYIGDLLGVRGLHPVSKATYSLRAFVANTLRYRRRKGTATMLEQLARDITGWNTRALEFFQLLATTQNYNHIRNENYRTPDIRLTPQLELLETPFDTAAHTVDVRRIDSGRGKYNIPNIGIFLWRLSAFPVYKADAYAHANPGCFSMSPLGNDIPLFNNPRTEDEITHLAEEINVPGALRRRPLFDELEARRQALSAGKSPMLYYFGLDDTAKAAHPAVFKIYLDGNTLPVPAAEVCVCNLQDWHRPQPPIKVAVDPQRGRLTVAGSVSRAQVSYFYGFSGEVGGGCYKRELDPNSSNVKTFFISEDVSHFGSLADAINEWQSNFSNENPVFLVKDSRIYKESLPIINIPDGKTLEIRAAEEEFPLIKINGDFEIKGGAQSKLILEGLRISSQPLIIKDGDLGFLVISHCTLVPGLDLDTHSKRKSPDKASMRVGSGNSDLKVSIQRSICGAIEMLANHDLEIKESIIQGSTIEGEEKSAIEGSPSEPGNGPNLVVESSTILGPVFARVVRLASNTIFTGTVKARLTQEGCVRFCYLPGDSQVPRRYRCQPDLAIRTAVEAALLLQPLLSDAKKEEIAAQIGLWLRPVLTSQKYGEPGYCQLHLNCPKEISRGAEEGSEMGVWRFLQQPHRLSNLENSLVEYLPAAMKAGIFFIN